MKYNITFWKIIFTYLIALLHFNNMMEGFYSKYHAVPGWYIAVDFFFIVSGYLLMYKANGAKEGNFEVKYTLKRIRNIYPEFLLAFINMFLLNVFISNMGLKEAVQYFATSIYELLFIRMWGFDGASYTNFVTWYLDVLFFVGFIVLFIVTRKKDLFLKVICPLAVLGFYAFLSRNGCLNTGAIEGIFQNDYFLRGTAGICLGCLCFSLVEYIEKTHFFAKELFLQIGSAVGFTATILLSLFFGNSLYDYLFVIILAFSICFAFACSKELIIYDNIVVKYLGKISLGIYLNHLFISNLFRNVWKISAWTWQLVVLYLIILTLFSSLTHFVCLLMKRILENIKEKCHQKIE